MFESKIHKALDKQPLLFGLEFTAFKLFGFLAAPLIIVFMVHASNTEGIGKIVVLIGVYMVLVAGAYILSSVITKFNISKKLSDDQFPDQILNNL